MSNSNSDSKVRDLRLLMLGIALAPDVQDQPMVNIRDWSVRRLTTDDQEISDHLFGFLLETDNWRISSPILQFNPSTRIAITQSGRKYQLVGRPGRCEDGLAVWLRAGLLQKSEDVTLEYSSSNANVASSDDPEIAWVIKLRDMLPSLLQSRTHVMRKPDFAPAACTPVFKLPAECISKLIDVMGDDALIVSSTGIHVDQVVLEQFVGELCRRHKISPEPLEEPDANKAVAKSEASIPVPRKDSDEKPNPKKLRGHCLVDQNVVHKRLDEFKRNSKGCKPDRTNSILSELLEELNERPYRSLLKVKSSHLNFLNQLEQDFPNFSEVIVWIKRNLKVKQRLKLSLQLPPFLMVGLPGVGKTEFARRLAEGLHLQYQPISIATSSASFDLHGSHKSWSTGQPGQITQSVIRLPDRKGLCVLLDEIDKIQDHQKSFPVTPVLLELLEPGQSDFYKDEFLQISMNITPVVTWVATANVLRNVSTPLLSRLQVFEIPQPSQKQMPAVVRSVDFSLRKAQKGYAMLFAPLSDAVIQRMKEISPREVRRVLESAYGVCVDQEANTKGMLSVTEDHLKQAINQLKTSKSDPIQSKLDDSDDSLYLMMQIKKPSGGAPPNTVLH